MAQQNEPLAKNEDSPRGFAFALTAYLLWGFLPFYMKGVAHIPALEVIAHRIVWSVPIAGVVLLALGRTADVKRALKTPSVLAMACVTAALITFNWGSTSGRSPMTGPWTPHSAISSIRCFRSSWAPCC